MLAAVVCITKVLRTTMLSSCTHGRLIHLNCAAYRAVNHGDGRHFVQDHFVIGRF